MIAYILKSSLSLILLYGLYWVLLRQQKIFIFNRFYLLFVILFSLVIPLITIPLFVSGNDAQRNILSVINNNFTVISSRSLSIDEISNHISPNNYFNSEEINLSNFLIFLYLAGVVLLLFRFLLNIFHLFRQIKISDKIYYFGNRLVLIDKQIIPYCFLNTIFVSKHDYLCNKIPNELLRHELEHLKQLHSLDVIFIEIIQIIYWFNPIFILFNRSVRVNHEYLADDGVIQDFLDIKSYSEKLINFISCRRNIPLTSGFNHSLTKKRLIMMSKPKSGNINDGLRIIATLCSALSFFFILSCLPSNSQPSRFVPAEETNPLTQQNNISPDQQQKISPDDYPTFQGGGSLKFENWVASQVKYPEEALTKAIEGRVSVNYKVEIDGTVSHVKISNKPNSLLGQAVLKVIQASPKWEQAKNARNVQIHNYEIIIYFDKSGKVSVDPNHTVVEEMPQFPAGGNHNMDETIEAAEKWIAQNVTYPSEAKKQKIEGRVIIQFIVNRKGRPEAVSVLNSDNPLLKTEAKRVVSSMPDWKPGYQGGTPVNVYFPVIFKLQ
jgi:TonB family protein